MDRVLKVTHFQLRDTRNALIIFYLVCAVVLSLFGMSISSGDGELSGFGMAAMIFIFIAGLNCLGTSFRFAQANNVSRRKFFFATSLALSAIAAFMAAVDVAMTGVLRQFLPYYGLFEQLYASTAPLWDFLWSFALFTFAAHCGWLITMIYYRSNALVKTLVSISPVFVILLLTYFNGRSDGALVRGIIRVLGNLFGLSGTPAPHAAVLTFLGGAVLSALGSWLLLRRASVRA